MPVSTSLRGRVPGQAAMAEIVEVQRAVPPRSLAARLFGVSPLTPASRGLYRAALGEVAVGEMLDQLGPRWDILHVVPVTATGQIDHLVIGPTGVFSITTENYPGQEVKVSGDSLTIGGRAIDDIPTARRLAASAAERLSAAAGHAITVDPIIVVIDSRRLVVREQPTGLTVAGSKQLLRILGRLDRALAGTVVAQISDVADRVSTWDATPRPAEESLALSQEFAVLRQQVRDATQTRVFWGVIGFAIVCASAWIGTVLIVEAMLRR